MNVADKMPASRPSDDLVDLDREAPALCPAQVHAQHHLGPVLGVGPPGAGVDLGDGVPLVVLAGEQAAQLEIVQGLGDGFRRLAELALQCLELFPTLVDGHGVEGFGIGEERVKAAQALDVVTYPSVLGGDLARLVGVRPQVGLLNGLLQHAQALDRVVQPQVDLGRVEAEAQRGQYLT